MNNIALGQYVDKDSLIHKMDPRFKIINLILLMVAVFMIPMPNKVEDPTLSFILLGCFYLFIFIIILFTKIPVVKYLKSLKQVMFLMLFTFFIQLLTPSKNGTILYNTTLYFSYIGVAIIIIVLVLFITFRKHFKAKLLLFLILFCLSIYMLTYQIGPVFKETEFVVFKDGLMNGFFYVSRIFIVILLSSILSLTTKPTDLTYALEWLLHPLTFLKINVSIFAMMMSIALRFIPTLFNESQKILKAQSSRGVDFKEGNLKSQINQVIALLIPMFVIALKRAYDLADAMEARCYIPGAKRTKYVIMHFKFTDYLALILSIALLSTLIYLKVTIV